MSKIFNAFAIFLICSQPLLGVPPIFVDTPEEAFILSKEIKLDVLIIFGADWCVYCENLKELINNTDSIVDDTIICFVDYDKRRDLVKEYKVKKIPDSFLYKNLKQIKRKTGFTDNADYIEWLNK